MFMNFISDSEMSCSVSKRVNRPLVSKSYFWSIFLIHLTWEEKPLWNMLGLGIVFESPFKKKKFSQWNIVGHHAIPIRMLRYWIAHFTCSREQMLIRFILKDRSFWGDYSWFNIRKNPFEWNIVEPQSWGGWWRNSHWDKWDKWDWGHRSWGIVRYTEVQ